MDKINIKQQVLNRKNCLNIKNPFYKTFVKEFFKNELKKDLERQGDITTEAVLEKSNPFISANVMAKQNGLMAGIEEINYFFGKQIKIKPFIKDGEGFNKGTDILELTGKAKDILKFERTILNFLQRMSGIATFTDLIINKAKKINKDILIVPTRKTLWGILDKKAVTVGGGGTHRLNLGDAILVKDNHLKTISNFQFLISKQILNSKYQIINKCFYNYLLNRIIESKVDYRFVEIEVEDENEALKLAETINEFQKKKLIKKPVVIMLDNFSPALITETLKELNGRNLIKNVLIEASGGINETNIEQYAKTKVDIISMGCLTNKATTVDMNLEINGEIQISEF